MITTTGVTGAANELVQRLFKKADTNGDGHVSAGEFQAFMTNALSTTGGKTAFMALAQHIPATTANLQQIASQLGPTVGHLSADGQTFQLANGAGAVGISASATGPAWQWLPATTGVSR